MYQLKAGEDYMNEEVSIKVHCIVSCLCEVLREETDIDYRPLYLGLWDAAFDVTEQGEITYYQHDLNHEHYYKWFEQLYGAPVIEWFDKSKSKDDNLERLLDLLEQAAPKRYIMAQIDMSLMPERENKFYQKPFPHFLILAKTTHPDQWMMIDPDFRWRGVVDKARVIQAFLGNSFGGGFYVDANDLRMPTPIAIEQYYKHVFTYHSELTAKLQKLIPQIAQEELGYVRSHLHLAVKQLPVLAIRKYSYEHALMYFVHETGTDDHDHEAYCELVEQLVQGFHQVQYLTMKLAMMNKLSLLPAVMMKLDELYKTEMRIKQELDRLYQHWRKMWRSRCLFSFTEQAGVQQ